MALNLKAQSAARSAAVRYLSAFIGERALAGSPEYVKSKKIWRIQILCSTPRGILPAGEMHLDDKLQVIYAPSKEELGRIVEAQLERLPYLVFAKEGELEAKGFRPIKI